MADAFALAPFGIAAEILAGGLVLRLLIPLWRRPGSPSESGRLALPAADLDARLARIEQIVETTAIEVERIAEAQRWSANILAAPSAPPPLAERVATPH